MNKPLSSLSMKVPLRRCAIYTRKSTEEGLEQEFNSLDAQRDACAAYILSQMHEGWSLLPGVYDDGGYSGGNMDRPALKQLLNDVREGKVDVIVVYKVDRLTRKGIADNDEHVVAISVEASFVRRGVEMKLRYSPKDSEAPPAYDVKLAELIAKAELAYNSLIEDAENVAPESRPHLVRLARLKFLAPDIVTSIIDGRQPPELTARTLMRGKAIPLCWEEQRAQYGFA